MQQNNRRLHPIIWFVILLAVVGILYQILNSPRQLITTLLIGAAVIAVFYFIFNRTSSPSGINGKYKKAVKQSKKRYGSNIKPPKASPLSSNKKTKSTSQKKRVREHNLTVIEGKKNKKKNRASF